MLEDCKILKDSIEIINSFTKGQNIRKKGEDVKKNTIVFREGRKNKTSRSGSIIIISKKIDVYKNKSSGNFSTGSEINKNSKRKKNYIFDANKLTLISMFKKIG